MGCYCDYELPDFLSTDLRVARKEHVCCEGSHVIVRGEKYEQKTGGWNGAISRYKTCEKCADLRDSINGCLGYGYLKDAYLDYLDNMYPPYLADGISAYDMWTQYLKSTG